MKLLFLLGIVSALVAAQSVCECCGPEGPAVWKARKAAKCIKEPTECAGVVKTFAKSEDVTVRCKQGDFYYVGDGCYVLQTAIRKTYNRIVPPCKLNDGCNAERGPQSAAVIRDAPCVQDHDANSSIVRQLAANTPIKVWCKSDGFYLTDDKCWVAMGAVPAKSSTIPGCGTWRPS